MHDSHGHEQHKTVEEALEEVMVESKRTQKHSMMGMFGLDPNKLDFDYEKHFPEHDFLQVYDDDYQPPGANRRPRPVRDRIFYFVPLVCRNEFNWIEFEIEILNLNSIFFSLIYYSLRHHCS